MERERQKSIASGRVRPLADAGLKPLEDIRPTSSAKLTANHRLMASLGLQATPAMVWRDATAPYRCAPGRRRPDSGDPGPALKGAATCTYRPPLHRPARTDGFGRNAGRKNAANLEAVHAGRGPDRGERRNGRAVLDTPDTGTDRITFVCPHTLARIGRYAPQPLACWRNPPCAFARNTGGRLALHPVLNRQHTCRRIFSILRPLAVFVDSSLSSQRIFCISGSSISSTHAADRR